MRIISILSILFLIIITALVKNSTREIENDIFSKKDNLSLLEKKYKLMVLELNFLSSPEKLDKLNKIYFEDNLKFIKLSKIKKLILKNNQIIQKSFENKVNEQY